MLLILKSKLSESHNWLLHHNYLKSLIRNKSFIKGKVLDIGCGTKPYVEYFTPQCELYIGLEHSKTIHGLDKVDILGNSVSLPFKDLSFDNLVSFQVMEHVPEPLDFLREAFRVLKPGGYIFLTTPFMWGEHEEPYDYFRYTRYGLRYLVEKVGFKVIEINPDSKYWTTAVLRFNYYLLRFARGRFKPVIKLFLLPIFTINQVMALFLDMLPHNYTIDTVGFSSLFRKPN
jgi:SAM-dependent methyltransferase